MDNQVAGKFQETREAFGPFTKIRIENIECKIAFEVVPEKGARVNAFTFYNGNKEIEIIDGYNTAEDLNQNAFSKSSILAPFPNRTADGIYTHNDKEYQLPINKSDENNSIHGFVEHESFSVVESGPAGDGYKIHLQYESDSSHEGYPFPFKMDVTYKLTCTGLEVETSVLNTGETSMPFGHGWHPYFKTSNSIQNVELLLPDVEEILVDNRLIPTGVKEKFNDFNSPKILGDIQFDTGFKMMDGQGRVTLIDRESNLQIDVVMEEENNPYQYVQIFTPPAGCLAENTIAIEPMTCEANALNSKRGLLALQPGETFTGCFQIKVSTLD